MATPTSDQRSWTISTSSGVEASGYLPEWAEKDPTDTGVPLERFSIALADITHRAPFEGSASFAWTRMASPKSQPG